MPLTHSFFSNVRFADALDIAVISILVYFLLTWVQRRSSRALIVGIAFLVILYGAARLTHMYLTLLVFQAGFTAALVALVIVFQEDIRSMVERIVSWKNYTMKHQLVAPPQTTDILTETVMNLARDRIGGLIIIKGRTSLDRHLSGGILLNGRISLPLLYSIFHPETPSHDGAVLIEANRIEKFGVHLPLSHNLQEIADAGTRHSAGLGISEHSDALAIIVSEERGTISLAEDGRMKRVGPDELRTRIDAFYSRIFPRETGKKHLSVFTHNPVAKCLSVSLSFLFWFVFAYRTETINRNFTVPIEYRNIPSDWIIEAPNPPEVQVSLSGMERAFNFDPSRLAVSLDMSNPKESIQTVSVAVKDVKVPFGLKVHQILPRAIALHAYKVEPVDIPVKVITKGQPTGNFAVSKIEVHPSSIRIVLPLSKSASISEVYTEPLTIDNLHESAVFKAKVRLPNKVHLVDATQNIVKVTITIERKKNVRKR